MTSIPLIETIAASGLQWLPRWMAGSNGEKAKLDYEQPIAFSTQYIENKDKLWGCDGTISSSGNWNTVGDQWVFVPVKESSLVPTEVLDLLGGQKMCGLLARGIGGGNCDEVPQAQWATKPSVYCDADWYCWIGDPNDRFYQKFWSIFYDGEDGCDPNGGTHTCCDPTATSTELPPCNAFISVGAVVQATVEITDEDINDPTDAASWAPDCAR